MTTKEQTLRDEAREAILEETKYWDSIPALVSYSSADELQRNYENQSGPTHWFDRDTLRFFGSRNRHLVRPGVMVETQMNAPDGVGRYAVTAWVVDPTAWRDHREMGRITPNRLGSFHSLVEARRFAVAVAEVWGEVTK